MPIRRDLILAALALVLLPFVLGLFGLGVTSATEVVIFALACMALNILVGYTGLTSFGHGAWFGLAAYAVGMTQRAFAPGSFVLPALIGLALVIVVSLVFGFLILRRRGVYFSLLTLALSAMLYSVAFRWTEVTGGENGLGGITRPVLAGVSFESAGLYYVLVACIAFAALFALWRFHRSPLGSVLVAIRENEQRARFIGYPTNRVKLTAFVASATLTGLAGMLLALNNRMTSAEPISVAFSGELLAMVIIGGMRSFLGPALGALFFVIFRDSLSRVTEHWLLAFGILFVAFIVFSPTGLVGLYERATARWRKVVVGEAAMAQRQARQRGAARVPAPTAHGRRQRARSAESRQTLRRNPGSERHVAAPARPNPARADRPERCGQDDRVQPDLGAVHARSRHGHARRPIASGAIARGDHAGRNRPLVPDHESVRLADGRRERAPGGAGAAPQTLCAVGRCVVAARREPRRRRSLAHDGPGRRGTGARGVALLRRAAPARHGGGARHPPTRAAAR